MSLSQVETQPGTPFAPSTDAEFQAALLEKVSRTFALTIPQLPSSLVPAVANAYLLCRIVDTIEDDPNLAPAVKRSFCVRFSRALAGEASATRFAEDLAGLLSPGTAPGIHELIRDVPRVLSITGQLNTAQRRALHTCVGIMAFGMAEFQERRDTRGLPDLPELGRYCYHVAGVVGEMLTELFCDYSPAIEAQRERLLPLSVSFGQGLQMTNILKDIWEDLAEGACWLPRDVFAEAGYDLQALGRTAGDGRFAAGLRRLIAIAHGHLEDALRYTLLIPAHETGIRNFCLWAIGMAVLTLRNIQDHPDFQSAEEVKITRNSVRLTVTVSRLTAAHDRTLQWLFRLAGRGVPRLPQLSR